jgi:ParB family transcriptional regulator, chromosome partitioning protein
MPGEMVQEKSNGRLRLVDPGTGAVLHGLMNMLSEVLDGLDRRLDAMETRMADLAAASPPPAPTALDTSALETAIEQLSQRVEGLDAAVAEQVSSLSVDVAGAGARVASIQDAVAATVEHVESAVAERLTHVESALAERIAGLDDAFADRRVELAKLEQSLLARFAALETVLDERIDAIDAAVDRVTHVEAVVGEGLAAFDDRLTNRVSALEQSLQPFERLLPQLEQALPLLEQSLPLSERSLALSEQALAQSEQSLALSERSLTQFEQALPRLEQTLAQSEQSLAQLERLPEIDQAIASINGTLGDTAVRVEEVVQAAVGRRMAQIEASLAEARAEAEAVQRQAVGQVQEAIDARLGAVGRRLDEVAGQLAERIGQGEQITVAHAEKLHQHIDQTAAGTTAAIAAARADTSDVVSQAAESIVVQLSELDAALAALRAESAGLPANVGEQVQAAIGSWRNRLRRGEGDADSNAVRKAFEDLTAQLATTADQLGEGLTRIHEAVNRAQGESLEAAQTTTAEVRRLLDAARADTERHAGEQLDGVAAVAERLVVLHEDLSRRDARLAQALRQSADATGNRIDEAQQAIVTAVAGADSEDDEVRNWLNDEFARLRSAVQEAHVRAGTVAATVARQVDEVVQAAVAAVTDRVANERTTADGIRRDVEVLAARLDELGKSVSAGRREFAATAQGLPDLIRNVIDLDALAAGDKTVLEAVATGNQEHQEVLQAMHSSLSKRFDARIRVIAETLDGLTTSLEAARTLGPSLDKVSSRLESQQPHLDQIRSQLVQLAATITSVPADVERRHNEAVTSLDRVTDSLGSLRKHAASLDRAVQSMRASHDGLVAAFVDLRDGNGIVPQRLDQIGSALDATRRQLGEVVETGRTVVSAVDQQQAMGNRLAELVTQVRAATRSDIERVESSIHLEVLKQHQQDQARLTQAVAGVSEVVEREAGVIAQRVGALASEVDAIRSELASRQDA